MDAVDEIRRRIDIVDVVSESVALKRAGRNYKAVCPFHTEKTPSFFVFPDRQAWHCFGACSTGGDVFAFVMRRQGVDFAEALRFLAERAGVALHSPQSKKQKAVRERLQQANEAAVLFFQNALFNSAAGQAASDYMTMRGIDRETAQAYRLGYSLDSWDGLRQHLRDRGFSDDELLRAGLLVEGEVGPYDRFRDRLMIPIRDGEGRTVGFGSRVLPESQSDRDGQSPKYLNSPQTPIFDKGAILYGLDRAREHIRQKDRAVIVEGYMDVLAAHQHENMNVVASMGTALTERQVDLLRQYTKNIVLAFDPDEAGRAASERGFDLARNHGIDISVMRLPEGRDPDEIIRAAPEEWHDLVLNAKPLPLDSLSRPVSEEAAAASRRGPRSGEQLAVDTGKAEETLLALLLRFPDLRREGVALDAGLFVVSRNRELFDAWRNVESLSELDLSEELSPHLDRIAGKELPPYDAAGAERALKDCIGRIERRKLIEAKSVISQTIAEKEQELGSARLVNGARRLHDGAPPDELPEDDAVGASIVVHDMEAGRELHGGPREALPSDAE